jgi:outer membrane lipoprotein-sorting protein
VEQDAALPVILWEIWYLCVVRPTIVIGLFVLVLRGALAQAQPDVAEILKKVSETYKGVSEYELVGDGTDTDSRSGKREAIHMLFAFKGPNRYRMEGTGAGVAPDGSGQSVTVYDGSVMWMYLPESNQYGSFPGSELFNDGGDGQDAKPEAMDQAMMSWYRGAGDAADGAKFLREEAIEIAGAKIDCYVVSAKDRTWWVNKTTSRVVREDHGRTSVVFTTIKLGEPLPDSLFKFEPPPGAKKIEPQ